LLLTNQKTNIYKGMPDVIKFNSSSTESQSLRKGNIYIGVGDVGKGPTSLTGFKGGVNLGTSKYLISLHRASGVFSHYLCSDDSELISKTNKIDTSIVRTTKEQCFSYFAGQSDKMVTNKEYEPIITDGLVLNLDMSYLSSYPATGSTCSDLSSNQNNGTLVNSPIFNSNGWIQFDGQDEQVNIPNSASLQITGDQTLEFIVYPERHDRRQNWYDKAYGGEGTITYEIGGPMTYYWGTAGGNTTPYQGVGTSGAPLSTLNRWYHVVLVRELSTATKTVKWYINGVLNVTVSASYTAAVASTTQIRLGTGYTNFFLGRMSIARQYNISLSQSQVLQNYYGRPVVTNSLILAIDASNLVSYHTGGVTASSLVGSISATLENGVTFSSQNSGSWIFDNSNDYIQLPNDLGYSTTTLSVFSWFKSNGQPLGNYHIVCGGQECEISVPWPGGQIRTGVLTNTRFVSNHGSGLNDGSWHYIGFTYDGSTKRSYIDGVSVGTQVVTGTLVTSFSNRRLGRFGSSSDYYLNGHIASYWVYNRVVSDSEVLQNFNAHRSRYGV
jgi:hypothetical protein